MKTMTDRDKQILFILLGIIILACSYFFVFTKFNAKKATVKAENVTLSEEVTKLQNMVAAKASVIQNTEDTQVMIKQVLDKFPAEVRTQNAIKDLNDMYNDISSVEIQSEGYTMDKVFYTSGMTTDTATGTTSSTTTTGATPSPQSTANPNQNNQSTQDLINAAKNYVGFQSDVTVSFLSDYDGIKKVVDFINKNSDRMTITSMDITKEDGEKKLECNMVVSMYAISNTGKGYTDLDISGNDGHDNIFK